MCFIMPERIAKTDPYKQIDEYVGSGPYRFLRDEWQPGALASFARFDGYVPRQEPPSFVAGGKQANFDRIEWIIIPDAATCAAAIQAGEAEWWQSPTVDLLPLLRKARDVVVERLDDYGIIGVMRFNMLHPPFDNVKLRRAILPAINQADFMDAAMGGDRRAVADRGGRVHAGLAAGQHRRAGGADRPARSGAGEAAGGRERLQAARRWCSWRPPTIPC